MRWVLACAMAATFLAVNVARAEEVPCENKLEELRAALKTATLSEDDAAKVKDLQDKGMERCNADDDARADEFFDEALKILGK